MKKSSSKKKIVAVDFNPIKDLLLSATRNIFEIEENNELLYGAIEIVSSKESGFALKKVDERAKHRVSELLDVLTAISDGTNQVIKEQKEMLTFMKTLHMTQQMVKACSQ